LVKDKEAVDFYQQPLFLGRLIKSLAGLFLRSELF
jgi:hypothetical protein